MSVKNLIGILQIVSKYVDASKEYVCAEHDVIILPLANNADITPADHSKLKELGAFQSHEYECWSYFV